MKFINDAAGEDKNYTPEAMAQIFSALFDKIHPLVIGAIEQSYALSKLIGTRCLETHMTGDDAEDKIKKIVDTLCDDFKSHAYQIPRREAEKIGLNVKNANEAEESAITDLLKFYLKRPFMPAEHPKPKQQFKHRSAWLDSTQLHMAVEGTSLIDDDGGFRPLADKWVVY